MAIRERVGWLCSAGACPLLGRGAGDKPPHYISALYASPGTFYRPALAHEPALRSRVPPGQRENQVKIEELLERATAASQSGRREEARELLVDVLALDAEVDDAVAVAPAAHLQRASYRLPQLAAAQAG